MNEEEIIKYVEEEIKSNINIIGTYENENNPLRQQIVEHVKAYKGLLDLYKKEKRKTKLNITDKQLKEAHDYFVNYTFLGDKTAEYIMVIFNALYKEKEKNKELEYGLYETQESYKLKKRELELNLQNFSKIYISKDKIKEVIKDLEKFNIDFYSAETLKECFKNSLLELLEG